MTKKDLDDLTYEIIGCAITVHKELGPGLLESVYQHCLAHEFNKKGIAYSIQPAVPVHYRGAVLDASLRCDMLVENKIVIELKAVNAMDPVFTAQLLTYMKLLRVPKGILLNFYCVNLFKEGQKTYVNNFYEILPD